jgi:hypothetical protein
LSAPSSLVALQLIIASSAVVFASLLAVEEMKEETAA